MYEIYLEKFEPGKLKIFCRQILKTTIRDLPLCQKNVEDNPGTSFHQKLQT
jgi:hypothetical protein